MHILAEIIQYSSSVTSRVLATQGEHVSSKRVTRESLVCDLRANYMSLASQLRVTRSSLVSTRDITLGLYCRFNLILSTLVDILQITNSSFLFAGGSII